MGRMLIGLIVGLLIGGAGTYYFILGAPAAATVPGTPVQPPDPSGPAAGTAQIVLRQDFFNDVLGTIFNEMNAPSFALAGEANPTEPAPGACPSVVTARCLASATSSACCAASLR